MKRSYYATSVIDFLKDSSEYILGSLTQAHQFSLDDLQRNAWIAQIQILQYSLQKHQLKDAYIAFEFSIPRMGKRVDIVILYRSLIFVIEFKVGETKYSNSAREQALDYSLDLKNFHEQSHFRNIVPIVVATEAPEHLVDLVKYEDGIFHPINCNKNNLIEVILDVASEVDNGISLDPIQWIDSVYKPTPTIIEAAQALYKGHNVKEISRSDSGAVNLSITSNAISDIIQEAKSTNSKAICFITGVPGAGKTLAGLNIANERHNVDEGEHAVFLSGNGPLVAVLQEALARSEVADSKNSKEKLTKSIALSRTKAFIQNIHHFRDDNLRTHKPPIERVAVFDEAQRAWDLEQTSKFMVRKKGIEGFNMSEPEFLISVLDRHEDWATIICLIGGGQEINTGETGLPGWFSAIEKDYPHWNVFVSEKLTDSEYTNGNEIYSSQLQKQLNIKNELHLSVSVRSYRSNKLAAFVKALLDLREDDAKSLFSQIKDDYPIKVTRDLDIGREWIRSKARGGESLGIIASSGALRLKPYGIHIKSEIDPTKWFLNDKEDIRSAGFLEDVATEFDIQGLELDWTCLAWDANLRMLDRQWNYKNFRGTEWQNVHDKTKQRFLLNTYRVLLTRARQGMIIFIPPGNVSDRTRLPEFYDEIFQYLIDIGVPEV